MSGQAIKRTLPITAVILAGATKSPNQELHLDIICELNKQT
jgi:hypothetical protein